MLYKYEPHCHTSEGSKCGRMSGAEFARLYKSLGYTGIFVTDHFYKGNTAVPRELAWDEWVTEFVKGYQNAKAEGDRIGLDVFFAWEYSGSHGADFLIYGLDADWLYQNPDQINWSTHDYMQKVRESGGTVVHAHPFRRPEKYLLPEVTDAVEVINTHASDADNARAAWYAESYGFRGIGGSDNHGGIQRLMSGIYMSERIVSTKDFAERVKSGEAVVFLDRYDDEGNRL